MRDGRSDDIRRVIEALTGVPATDGNRVEVLRNGDQIFPAMLHAIRGAQDFVDLLTFVYWTGDIAIEFADALAERARAGVRVRTLLDAVGARSMDPDLLDMMKDAGVEARWFRPPSWKPWELEHRTHRKVLVVDERIGFTGGVGIAQEWVGDARDETEWRDTHFQVEGPAVDGLRGAFEANWIETSELSMELGRGTIDQPAAGDHCAQVIRSSASIGWSTMAIVMRALFRIAEERIRISSAYFTPDETTLGLLAAAADRGVDVEVLVPGPHADKRIVQVGAEATYGQLLDAGVRVWAYQPTMLHTKIITVDGAAACVGSANVNGRSMARDDEVALMLYDPALVDQLDGDFDDDLERAEQIDGERWQERSLTQRVLERSTALVGNGM